MEHVLAVLLGLVVGQRIPAMAVAVVAAAVLVGVLEDAGVYGCGRGASACACERGVFVEVEVAGGELAVFVAAACFDCGVAV
jgi:hypothetical protein